MLDVLTNRPSDPRASPSRKPCCEPSLFREEQTRLFLNHFWHLSDTCHFRHFRRFRGSEERNAGFQWVDAKFSFSQWVLGGYNLSGYRRILPDFRKVADLAGFEGYF